MHRGTFGDQSRFSITVGEILREDGRGRRVDVWAARRWLTCADSNASIPFFISCLADAVDLLVTDPRHRRLGRPFPEISIEENFSRLKAEDELESEPDDKIHWFGQYRFMHWGPTTDNYISLLFQEDETVFIAFTFVWPDQQDPAELGKVFVAELPAWELAAVLHRAAWALMWDWADQCHWPKI